MKKPALVHKDLKYNKKHKLFLSFQESIVVQRVNSEFELTLIKLINLFVDYIILYCFKKTNLPLDY